MTRAGPQSRIETRDPSVMVFMSLYLILLTFFIVLAALSRIENRRLEQTLSGVEHSFGGAGGRSRVSVIESLHPSAVPGSDVAALLGEELAALSVLPFASLSAERGEVRLAMPARLFFPPSGSELTGPGEQVLNGLAKVAARVEEPFRLDILLVRPASFWGLGPLPLDRAAALRAALPEAIGRADIGIVDAGGGDIVFRFRIVQGEERN